MTCDAHGERKERLRAEAVCQTLVDISRAVNTIHDLRKLFERIHSILGRIIDVTNFFIGIVDRRNHTIFFPFFQDEKDEGFAPNTQFREHNSLSGEVIRMRRAMLLRASELEQRAREERIVGTMPLIWLGVPLIVRDEVQGVMGLQSYTNPDLFDHCDLELLTSVSYQVAAAIDRKMAADILRTSEERFRGFVEGTDDLVVQLDKEGGISYANHTAEKIFGFPAARCVGRSIFDFVHPEEIETFLDGYMQLLHRRRTNLTLENRLINPVHGVAIPLNWSINAQYDIQGQSVVLNAIARDLTDQKRAEEERLKIQKLESIGVLSGGIAHDFNNLLSVVMGNLDLVQAVGQLPDDGKTCIQSAKQACLRAKDLTRQLITFSKGGAPRKMPGVLDGLIRDCVRRAGEGFAGRILLDLADNLWPVSFDAVQIGQAIDNLLTNAIEAMAENGDIVVRAANCRREPDTGGADGAPACLSGRCVQLVISDTGIGIPDVHRSKIFDPYFTTKSRGTQKGMGLGLATTYAIVSRHQGEIQIWSAPGKGTTVQVFLPAAELEDSAIRAIGMEPGPGDPKGTAGNRIMVMDDEPMIVSLATQMLECMEFTVTAATDGENAVEYFRQALEKGQAFDAVILDLTIENGQGGLETLQQIRALDSRVKAIVSSGYSDDPVIADPAAYGFTGALPKPYSLQELAEVLRKVLAGADILKSPIFASLARS